MLSDVKSFVKERLPRDISFSIEGTTLHLGLKRIGLVDNMQKAPCAFEGWAICLKANYPERIKDVVIDWNPLDISTLTVQERGHYYRFLYRAIRFQENYIPWARLNPGVDDSVRSELSRWVLNYPKSKSTDSNKENPEAESHLERSLLEQMQKYFYYADHQLPVGLFLEKVSEDTSRTSRQGSQIDLWAYNSKNGRGRLFIFELKNRSNKSVGIISELLFYTNVMRDFVSRFFKYPSEFSSEKVHFRSCEALYSLIVSKQIKEIQGVFLADFLHPFITEKALELLKSNKNEVRYRWLKTSNLRWIMTNSASIEEYADAERKRQCCLYYRNKSTLWEGAENNGAYNYTDRKGKVYKTCHFPFVLQHQDGDKNLFSGIRESAKEYFSRYNIKWWREDEDGYAPTGHLMSSQNHCLNHLFAIREDDDKVLAMINGIQDKVQFKKVLPVPIDDKDEKSYIAFEFVHENKRLLGESYQTRGSMCTSVDAMVFAEDGFGKKWLIPIEWKYTEHYDLMNIEYESSLKRYRCLVGNDSNLKCWPELFDSNPLYEFARQTLLVEKIISDPGVHIADDYLHMIVIPNKNSGLRKIVSELYMPELKDPSKVILADPEELLAPVSGDFIEYLRKRYW